MIHASTEKIIYRDNLLTDETKAYLNLRVTNFKSETNPKDSENYYYREYLDSPDSLDVLKDFLNGVYETIRFEFAYPQVKLAGIWINRVDSSSNINDAYHTDISKFSSVTFLNSDFEGGDFQYWAHKENRSYEVKLDQFKSIVFEGSITPHRVRPVSSGIRYSLVTFWDLDPKTTKTLL